MSVETQIKRSSFSVREPCEIEMVVRSSQNLVRGDVIEIQLPNAWAATPEGRCREFQTLNMGAAHYIGVFPEIPQAAFEVRIRPRHLSHPSGPAMLGRHIVATLRSGALPANVPVRLLYANTYAPHIAESESVWLRVKGEAPVVAPMLTVNPGPVAGVRIIAPSGVEPGEPFEVVVVTLDRFDNAASTNYENEILTTLDGKIVARWLTFCGRVRVPVTLSQPGTYRFRFKDAVSNAVRVAPGARGPYWGDLHIHSRLSHDGQGGNPFAYARDVSGLDFAAAADHWESLGEAGYRQGLEWARESGVEGRFVTLFGDERNPPEWGSGHHNLYFRDEESFCTNRALKEAHFFNDVRYTDRRSDPDPLRMMLVPHHTGVSTGQWTVSDRGVAVDWDMTPDRGMRPVMEIYSHVGQSELYSPSHPLSYEFNGLRDAGRKAHNSVPGPYYAQDWWMAGHRVGVIASSDDHTGRGGLRCGGVAAVFASELSRSAVFDALRARQCYGTTGERILVDFRINDCPMGGELRAMTGSPLSIRLRVWGTDILTRVEILRYRVGVDRSFMPLYSAFPRPETLDVEIDVEDTFRLPTVYYARVTQEPAAWPAMAWTSPVWVDEDSVGRV